MTTATRLHTVAPAEPLDAPAAPRINLYAAIHRALRMAMTDALLRVGSVYTADASATRTAVTAVRELLAQCRHHLETENAHLHPAIEAARAGASARITAEHEEHVAAIDALEVDAARLESRPSAASADHLYRRLALFVAENFVHMDVEETVHNAALWAAYSDAELVAIHDRLLASISPADMFGILHWMLPAIAHADRALMLREMRGQMPAPAFEAVLALASERLPADEWHKLEDALENPLEDAVQDSVAVADAAPVARAA
ncbi:MAG: hemerythrin domain-containing protein [Lautropia sp.]